ncbi:hypothetical protein [Nostoc sp.]
MILSNIIFLNSLLFQPPAGNTAPGGSAASKRGGSPNDGHSQAI